MMLGFVAFWIGIALVAYIVIVLILLILHEMQIEKPLLTTGLLFVVILLLVYIGRRSLFAAVELSVATILFVIVLGVFKSSLLSDQKKKIEALLMDRNILDNAKKTLTSGAAMLSVISCYTTACGMHDVVFGGWLAYPASIAVQVTLAFLSFFLLRFVLSVRNLNWPRIAEKVVSYVLILVAAGYLTISSLFSYSFIATKAYERTKNENNEAIARTYFIETVNLLESENEQRGTALYSELSGAINDSNGLSLAIQIQQAVENEQLNAQIISALAGVSNMSVTVTIEQDDDLNDVPEYALTQSAKNTLIQSNSILRGWIGKLTTALSDLNAIAAKEDQLLSSDDYNKIKSHYNSLYGSSGNNASDALNQMIITTSEINSVNGIMRNHIQSTQNAITELKAEIDQLKPFLESANSTINQISQSIQNNSNNTSIQTAEEILKRINEIQLEAEISGTQDAAKNDLDDLLLEIDAWTLSKNLSSQSIEKIREFCEHLKEYRKYIELKQTLEKFNEDAIKKVYIVVSSEEDEKTVGNLLYTTKAKWLSSRNEAFYTLESSITLLPNISDIEVSTSKDNSKISAIPGEAIRMQRILFSELTNVEQAINYFGSEYAGYRKMAFFSVAMAVFFDLGAFISGNLVMLIQYFEKDLPGDEDTDNDD